ncbi:MAG TPA: manganese efflux pump [Streptosporangiaceae bacterium]|jgi:putative Mn2+ efflux pump MntP|nr:manganese efflux pump [Streptosporangiaceae bacterium]
MLALLLVAGAVGSSNLVAAIGLGVSGVDTATRWRVGLVFGVFEAGMPVVGLLIGEHTAVQLGQGGRWLGGALLVGVGVIGLIGPIRARRSGASPEPTGVPAAAELGLVRLVVSGLALSLDNLVIGFALGTYQTPILVSALIIGGVSVAMSLAGLEIGARLGRWSRRRPGSRADKLGAALLIGVGIAVAAGVLS